MQADDPEAYAGQRKRPWLVVLPLAIFVLIAIGWSIFWYMASTAIATSLNQWRTREAAAGRTYQCAQESVGGYPFRFELRCRDPSAVFRSGAQPAALSAKDYVAVAQVWQPTLLIGEMIGPLMLGRPDEPPLVALNWSLAQASLRGLPTDPERVSVAVDQFAITSVGQNTQTMLANAGRIELHGRIAAGSPHDHPILELAVRLTQASASRLGELAAVPFDTELTGVLRGLQNFSFHSWPQTLQALQAANGRLDITRARFQQGEVTAVGTGTLSLTPRGALDGEFQVTIANIELLLPALGIDRSIARLIPPGTIERLAPSLDRLLPGLGGALRGGNTAAAAPGGVDPLGPRTELEGQSAVTLPLRITDGVVRLGPFKLTEIPPLY